MEKFVTQTEFANEMGVTSDTISKAIKRGLLPPMVNGKVDYNAALLVWTKKEREKATKDILQKRILILKGDLLEIERDSAEQTVVNTDSVVHVLEVLTQGMSKHIRNWCSNMTRKLKKNNAVTKRDLDHLIKFFNDSLKTEFREELFKRRK